MKNPFRSPNPQTLAQKQLLETRRALLDAQKVAEDWNAHVDVLKQRERRLAQYVREVQ